MCAIASLGCERGPHGLGTRNLCRILQAFKPSLWCLERMYGRSHRPRTIGGPLLHHCFKLCAVSRAAHREMKAIDVLVLGHIVHHLPTWHPSNAMLVHAELEEFILTIILEVS